MNKNELRFRLAKLDSERIMILNYLKNTTNEFSKEIYKNALDYINSQIDTTLLQLETYQEKSYEH